jgi:hypothetical protein
MVHDAPAEDSVQTVETSSGGGWVTIVDFPAGAIAHAWMDENSRQLTWDELTQWLRESPAA